MIIIFSANTKEAVWCCIAKIQ